MSERPDRSDHLAPDAPSNHAVRVVCRLCGGTQQFPVDLAALIGWATRRIPVQDAFAHLSAPDREYIRSRICPACWIKQFGTHLHHA